MCRCKLSRARLALYEGRLYRRIDVGDGRFIVVADVRVVVVVAAVVATRGDSLLRECRECWDVSAP